MQSENNVHFNLVNLLLNRAWGNVQRVPRKWQNVDYFDWLSTVAAAVAVVLAVGMSICGSNHDKCAAAFSCLEAPSERD